MHGSALKILIKLGIKTMNNKLITMCCLTSFILLSGCGSEETTSTLPVSTIPINTIENPVVGTPALYQLTDLSDVAQDSLVMTYKMLGIKNQEVQATTLVFTPKITPPVNGWRIVVWAHGTTGVADSCAPSSFSLDSDIKNMIRQLLQAGYVVVAPNYEGLGEPNGQEIHPFLNVKSEAYSMTDAVVAVKNYLGVKASNQWMSVGHSQGGQAALGAAQYASRAKLQYLGTVAVAPASNLKQILNLGEASAANVTLTQKISTYAGLDMFTALITAGLKNPNPNLQYSEVFKSPSSNIAALAESQCANTLAYAFAASMGEYAKNNNGTLTNYGRNQDNFLDISVVNQFISTDSQPLTVKVNTPVIIYQGTGDATVPRLATDALVSSAKALGTNIQYRTDDQLTTKWTHGTAYTNNINQIVQDVATLMPAK